MSSVRYFGIAVLIASSLAACAAEDSREGVSGVSIFGGTPVADSRFANVVALKISRGGAGPGFCSGTLVTPTLVITAAHCLASVGQPPVQRVDVFFGNLLGSGQAVTASRVNFHPAFQDRSAANDIGYVVLSQPVTNVQIIPAVTDQAEADALARPGASATVVGFGETEDGNVGRKYEVTTTVGGAVNGGIFIGGGGRDSCQGDSGGPAFGQVNGQLRAFAIVSNGVGCGGGGNYARMIDGLCWVEDDSGERLPNSKLPCDAPAALPAAAGLGNDLELLLSQQSLDPTADVFAFYVGATPAVTRAALCFGDLASCVQSQTISVGTFKEPGPNPQRSYFTGTRPMSLVSQMTVTALGFDPTGTLIHARSFSLVKKAN